MKNYSSKKHLTIIFCTVLLDMIGIGILIPIIPYLFDTKSIYSIIPAYINPNNSYLWQGIVLAIFPMFQFIMAPILGEISDHYGRKKILIFCVIGTLIGYVMTAYSIFTHNFIWFVLGRIIDGISGGNISIAMASIADVSDNKDKARNFGIIGAAFGIGFVIGPAIGGILAANFNAAAPFIFAGLLSVINILAISYFVKETREKSKDSNFKLHPSQAINNVISGFKIKELRNIFTVQMLYTSGFAFYTAFAGVYMKERFGFGLDQIGYYFAFIGICIGLTQGFIVPRVFNKKWSDAKILYTSLFIFSTVILVYIFSYNLYLNLILVPIFTVCIGLANTAISAITSKKAGAKTQGRTIGISSGIQALSGTAPQFLAGLSATYFVYYAPFFGTLILVLLATYFATKDK